MTAPTLELLTLASSITAAYLSKKEVPLAELPSLIRVVYQALADVDRGDGPGKDPAVSLRDSINPGPSHLS
jgi:predicted transcriptional regulator